MHVIWWMPVSVSIFRNSRERNSPALSHLMLPTILTGPPLAAAIEAIEAKSSSTFLYASDLSFRSLTNMYL